MTAAGCLPGDTGPISLTYVGESDIADDDGDSRITAIVDRARRSSVEHEITGALLFTGRRFVQTLEGAATVIDALMLELAGDPHHANLVVIDRRAIDRRAFTGWRMAYAGPSVYVSRSLERALATSHPNYPAATARLRRLLAEFARQTR